MCLKEGPTFWIKKGFIFFPILSNLLYLPSSDVLINNTSPTGFELVHMPSYTPDLFTHAGCIIKQK